MPRALRFVLALLLMTVGDSVRPATRLMASSEGSDAAAEKPAQQATLKPAAATAPDIPFSEYDPLAEQQLLDLANQARAQAGAPLLTLDAGMSRAARAHAE